MRILSFMLFIFLGLTSCSKTSTPLYVGTYTSGDSEGIYTLTFNQVTGMLTHKTLVAKEKNPSFIAFGPKKKYIYAVNESNDFKNSKSGSVSSFEVLDNGSLKFLNRVSSNGAHPCHVAVDESGNFIAVSNYTGGTLSVHKILADGSIAEASQVMDHNLPEMASHVHSSSFSDKNLFVADLGRNSVFQYLYDGDQYRIDKTSIVDFKENSGPRHFDISADGTNLYIINEYDNSVTTAQKNGDSFQLINHTSTLADSFKGESYCADIHISKDQRFIYGSNRGENSIVVFKRGIDNGTLQKIQNISVEGDWPRNFTISPNGNFMLVANQKSNNISVFKISKKSGLLNHLHSIDFPSPVCLLF